ncbi:hypothetical protein GCAAIG_05180 [Candidatus Electronema halotolerans]
MKKMQAKGAARKGGLPVRSNIKAGDFWDDMRSMYSSAYNKVAGLMGGGSSASADTGAGAAASGTPAGS